MNRFFVLSLLAVIGLAVSVNFAVAGPISYSETFAATGVQATEDGEAFSGYSDWSYDEGGEAVNLMQANVATAETLRLESNATSATPYWGDYAKAGISAQTLVGRSTFDLSTYPLTVSADVGGTSYGGDLGGWYNVGIQIGNVALQFHPGYSANSDRLLVGNTPYLTGGNSNFAEGTQYRATLTIAPYDSDNYEITVSIGNVYTGSRHDVLRSLVGDVSAIYLKTDGNGVGTGLFSNISVSQVPEPNSLALLVSGLLGLLCYAWRKCK